LPRDINGTLEYCCGTQLGVEGTFQRRDGDEWVIADLRIWPRTTVACLDPSPDAVEKTTGKTLGTSELSAPPVFDP
jgi:hypothetical protein